MRKRYLPLILSLIALVVTATSASASGKSPAYGGKAAASAPVNVTVFSPQQGDVAGKESKASSSISPSATRASPPAAPASS